MPSSRLLHDAARQGKPDGLPCMCVPRLDSARPDSTKQAIQAIERLSYQINENLSARVNHFISYHREIDDRRRAAMEGAGSLFVAGRAG